MQKCPFYSLVIPVIPWFFKCFSILVRGTLTSDAKTKFSAQQPCRIKSCSCLSASTKARVAALLLLLPCHTWDVQKKCRNSNEVVVAMSKQRRWKKESHCCRGFFLTLWILFFGFFTFFKQFCFDDDATDARRRSRPCWLPALSKSARIMRLH